MPAQNSYNEIKNEDGLKCVPPFVTSDVLLPIMEVMQEKSGPKVKEYKQEIQKIPE